MLIVPGILAEKNMLTIFFLMIGLDKVIRNIMNISFLVCMKKELKSPETSRSVASFRDSLIVAIGFAWGKRMSLVLIFCSAASRMLHGAPLRCCDRIGLLWYVLGQCEVAFAIR
jgi:hypothetical protein